MPGVDPGTAADADIRLREHQREMVAEARRVWGTAAARKLWLGYGLPNLTALPVETAENLERAFLADVLARRLERIAEAYETWTGTAAQLLALIERDAGPHDRSNTRWPANAQALGSAIARVKPLLAHRGIRIERRHSGIRTITLALVEA